MSHLKVRPYSILARVTWPWTAGHFWVLNSSNHPFLAGSRLRKWPHGELGSVLHWVWIKTTWETSMFRSQYWGLLLMFTGCLSRLPCYISISSSFVPLHTTQKPWLVSDLFKFRGFQKGTVYIPVRHGPCIKMYGACSHLLSKTHGGGGLITFLSLELGRKNHQGRNFPYFLSTYSVSYSTSPVLFWGSFALHWNMLHTSIKKATQIWNNKWW